MAHGEEGLNFFVECGPWDYFVANTLRASEREQHLLRAYIQREQERRDPHGNQGELEFLTWSLKLTRRAFQAMREVGLPKNSQSSKSIRRRKHDGSWITDLMNTGTGRREQEPQKEKRERGQRRRAKPVTER